MMMSSIWLILLTVVVLVLVLGGSGGATAMRKLLLVALVVGGVLAALWLVAVPFRSQSWQNRVYVPPHVEVYDDAGSVYIDQSGMHAAASDGTTASMQFTAHVPPQPSTPPPPPAPLGELAAWAKILIIGVPAIAALAALTAVRRPRGDGRWAGIIWLNIGVAALVLLGFMFIGRARVSSPIVAPINTYPDPGLAQVEPSDRALIEEQWDRFTRPRIALDGADPSPAVQADAQAELQGAAQTLQAASEKMGQATSQGWLFTAAKAILNAAPPEPAPTTAAAAAQPQPSPEAPRSAAPAADATADAPSLATERETPHTLRARKPEWVLRPPGIVGNVRKVVVSAGPYRTVEECHRDLEDKMRSVVLARVIELASAAAGGPMSTPRLERLNVGTDYILRELCTEEFVEDVDASFGPMKQAYALLEFTESQDAELLQRWKTYARRDRLAVAAFAATLVVGGLALAYGLLKVDTMTRGYYSKRLFLGVPAAIIGAVALLSLL